MGDNEFIEYTDTDDEEDVFWPQLKDNDGDIEEENRKIEERVSKIEDPEEGQALYEELLYALGYDEYFARRPYFKPESYLISMRMCLGSGEDEDIERFIDRILCYTNMQRTIWPCARNVLIVNPNRKFTFLNISKVEDASIGIEF